MDRQSLSLFNHEQVVRECLTDNDPTPHHMVVAVLADRRVVLTEEDWEKVNSEDDLNMLTFLTYAYLLLNQEYRSQG